MEKKSPSDNPVIQIHNSVISPREPRQRSVKVKTLKDYPDVPTVFLEVAQNYASTRLAGPPICDELIALIQHMFTEEEASIFRHLRPFPAGKTAQAVAAAENRPAEDVREILDRLGNDYRYMAVSGKGEKTRYSMIPMFPGSMEQIMFRNTLDSLTAWHRRFAELFDDLVKTGYMLDYNKHPTRLVRYLPVEKSIDSHPMAWPSDRLEETLDPYQDFAVTFCQCRVGEHLLERDCGRPLETCAFMGAYTKTLVEKGFARRAEKKEIIEIKREAEASGLVTWMINERSGSPMANSCSCCGCCCYMMRIMTEFNMPSMIAPPHFRPIVDASKCDYCGKCATFCTMGAITVNTLKKTRQYHPERCIGCGICTQLCDRQQALHLEPVPAAKRPPKNWLSLLAKALPNTVRNQLYARKTHKPD